MSPAERILPKVFRRHMKSREGAEEVVAALKAAGTDAASFQADLTKWAEVQAMVEKTTRSRAFSGVARALLTK